MRVRINKVESTKSDVVVAFESLFGSASAQWKGPIPEVGADYEVELEVTGILVWGSEIFETTEATSIYEKEGHVFLVGQLQSLNDESAAVAKIGDNVILIEIAKVPSVVPGGVLIRAPYLQLFDVCT
jgi:hypothetical protein